MIGEPAGFYMFGAVSTPAGTHGVFWTDSPSIAVYAEAHSHRPDVQEASGSPMPYVVRCSAVEAEVIGAHLDATGCRCVGLIGQTGYAILRTHDIHARRVLVGSRALAEWLQIQLGATPAVTGPTQSVRARSGLFGWTIRVDDAGAKHADELLSALGAERVEP